MVHPHLGLAEAESGGALRIDRARPEPIGPPLLHLVDLALLGGKDVGCDRDEVGLAQSRILRGSCHCDRRLVMRDHRVDERAVEGGACGSRACSRIAVVSAASGQEQDEQAEGHPNDDRAT